MARRILIYLAMVLGVAAFAGLFAVIFGNSTEVSCRRVDGQRPGCQITRALLGRYPISSQTVSDVTDVELDRDCDDGCTYRALLVSSNGQKVPVNPVSTDDFDGVHMQIEGIGTFLAGNAPSYRLEVPVAWWVVWLTGGLGVVGLFVLALNFVMDSIRR